MSAGGAMNQTEVKIRIDHNGNVHREVVERSQSEEKKPKIFKRLVSTLPI